MTKQQITLRLDPEIIDWFRRQYPDGYQAEMNQVLLDYVRARADSTFAVEQFLRRAALAGVPPVSKTWRYAWDVLVCGRSQTEVARDAGVEVSVVGRATRRVRDGIHDE